MATLATLPETPFPIGPQIFGPHNINGAAKQYTLSFVQIGWPGIGGPAFSFSIEVSADGGNTWTVEAARTIDDVNIPSKFGNPANTIRVACSLRGTGGRRVRLVLQFFKALTISGSLVAN
jgi:hypothetical protein